MAGHEAHPEDCHDARPAAAATLDLLASPACLVDADGHVAHLNAAWRGLAGFPDSPRAPIRWPQLLHPEHRDTALSRLRAAAAAMRPEEFECRLLRGDGTARWCLLALHPVPSPGSARHLLCTAADIHDMKLREAALAQRQSLQADMLNVSVDCIKVISLEGRLVHMNKAGCTALGVPEDSAFGMPWLPLLPEDVHEAGEAALAAARAGRPGRFPGRSGGPGEDERHWDNLLTPIIGADGRPTGILCVSRDVTAERRALASLRESEERLTIAARVGGLGIWDYDIRNDRLQCDESWYRIMGRDARSPISSIAQFRPLIHPDDVERATEVAQTAAGLIEAGRDYAITFRIVRPNGDIRWVRSLAYLQHRDGVPLRAIGFVADVTDAWRGELALRDANRALEEERTSLARKALEDPLTGIANRRHLDSEIARIRIRAGESGEPICVGMIDVDRFKQFNDRYGHLEGDAALRMIAAALQSVVRQVDFVARYGGEEFAFVLPGISDPAPVLERFIDAVADLAIAHADSPSGRLSISCGAVVSTRATLSPGELFKAGDEALYEAKMAGRDRYAIRFLEG